MTDEWQNNPFYQVNTYLWIASASPWSPRRG
jgi:hypothetical protein